MDEDNFQVVPVFGAGLSFYVNYIRCFFVGDVIIIRLNDFIRTRSVVRLLLLLPTD